MRFFYKYLCKSKKIFVLLQRYHIVVASNAQKSLKNT